MGVLMESKKVSLMDDSMESLMVVSIEKVRETSMVGWKDR